MKKEQQSPKEARRGFLRLASLGAVASGVAAVTGSAEAKTAEAGKEIRGRGYRVTEHVRKAYELARF